MNIISVVASYTTERLLSSYEAFDHVHFGRNDRLIMLHTGDAKDFTMDDWPIDPTIHWHFLVSKPRAYPSIMWNKVQVAREFCKDDSIFCSFDDDYAYNPYALGFGRAVFEAYPEVNYLSLLRGPGLMDDRLTIHEMLGFRFARLYSCMGGSIMARWSEFYPMVSRYFEEQGVTGDDPGRTFIFDTWSNVADHIDFWPYLARETGVQKHVYTLLDVSLVQQCCIGSLYAKDRGIQNPLHHMWGDRFDPRINPFTILGEK